MTRFQLRAISFLSLAAEANAHRDRKAAKRQSAMESANSNHQEALSQAPPFPPERVRKLLLNLKSSLGREEGQPLSFEDWSPIAGRPSNTLASWCDSGEAHQIQALLASLERLPEQARHQLLDEACRMALSRTCRRSAPRSRAARAPVGTRWWSLDGPLTVRSSPSTSTGRDWWSAASPGGRATPAGSMRSWRISPDVPSARPCPQACPG